MKCFIYISLTAVLLRGWYPSNKFKQTGSGENGDGERTRRCRISEKTQNNGADGKPEQSALLLQTWLEIIPLVHTRRPHTLCRKNSFGDS